MGRKHLTLEQRYRIEALHQAGHSQKDIAGYLSVHPSTISRELRRNSCQNGRYNARTAQKTALERCADRHAYKLSGALRTYVEGRLAVQWSPQQISHTLPEHLGTVSHEAIYLLVHIDAKQGGDLHVNLRWGRKKRRKRLSNKDKRGKIKNAVNIGLRPEAVDKKERIGDWEADTVVLKDHRGCLLTLVERTTKFLLTALLPDRKAHTVTQAIIDRFRRTSLPVLTVTYDNGKEFSGHEQVNEIIKCESYFCDPYSSWQRGLNENTNGLLRQYIPKGQTLKETAWQDLRTATNRINNRPRKALNWTSPREYIR